MHLTQSGMDLCSIENEDCRQSRDLAVVARASSSNIAAMTTVTARVRGTATTESSDLGPYWIDVFCIDQSNLSERSQYVAWMRDIYSSVQSILQWSIHSITLDRSTYKRS